MGKHSESSPYYMDNESMGFPGFHSPISSHLVVSIVLRIREAYVK
jgi:hypothetical protein